jgi:hypothetical protein
MRTARPALKYRRGALCACEPKRNAMMMTWAMVLMRMMRCSYYYYCH